MSSRRRPPTTESLEDPMPSLSRVTPDPEDVRAMADHERKAAREQQDVTRGVYLEELAERLYEAAILCDATEDPADDWTRLSPSQKSRYRFEATAALNRLNPAKRLEAELRAREQVADAHYGKAFHLLSGPVQRAIVFQVRTAINTADRSLEGCFEPLNARIALTLASDDDMAVQS